MENFTKCSYCKKVFNNPIVLSCCGESICETDLDNLYLGSTRIDLIKCPFDGKVISIPENGFPVNKAITKMLEMDISDDHAKAKRNMKLFSDKINVNCHFT